MVFLSGSEYVQICVSFVYICIAEIQLSRGGGLRSSYQEEVGWDPVIKRKWVEIQLSRGGGLGSSYQEEEDWDPINRYNSATFVCLS